MILAELSDHARDAAIVVLKWAVPAFLLAGGILFAVRSARKRRRGGFRRSSSSVRLVKAIPGKRLRLISGDAGAPPAVGDLGEADQCFAGFWGPMVLVYFVSADGRTEWEASAYESELGPGDGA